MSNTTFNVPTKNEVSEANQAIFDTLEKGVGFVPNIYATYAYNETALGDYLTFQNRVSTLKAKEKEVINLVVSQVNNCRYCQAAHTAIGKMNGFSEDQILEIRGGAANFDEKLNALTEFVQDVSINRGHPSKGSVDSLINAGYNKANLVDILMVIGEKTVTNYLHGITQIPIDFPEALELETQNA